MFCRLFVSMKMYEFSASNDETIGIEGLRLVSSVVGTGYWHSLISKFNNQGMNGVLRIWRIIRGLFDS